tara:strand:- start:1731 stop:2870 length:1140 start_codon:yes stop_codon:yes gene_type:complete
MKKGDKVITTFYIFLAISVISVFLYLESNLMHREVIDILPQPAKELNFERVIPVEREVLFGVITDVSNYPQILPSNVLSVDIIEKNGNEVVAEETIIEKGVKLKVLVRHTITPYEEHIIEILDGDAKDTRIIQTFYEENSSTRLVTKINLELHGLAEGFAYLPKPNLIHAADTVLDAFTIYAKGFDSKYEKIVDTIYREILFRPADKAGLDNYATQLENGTLTEDKLREILLKSEERIQVLKSIETKSLAELSNYSKTTIHKIYLEILYRQADESGLRYYATQLENGTLTEDEIRQIIFDSDEAYALRINTNERLIINDIFIDIFERQATESELEYFEKIMYEGAELRRDMEIMKFEVRAMIVDMKENSKTIVDLQKNY